MKAIIKNSKAAKAVGVFILLFLFSLFSIMAADDLPPQKWTQRRDGDSINAGS